jgi:ribose 5-phosphate isomerase A
VIPLAVDIVHRRLDVLGGEARIREKDGEPFRSDNGNFILDWNHGPIDDPAALEKQLKGTTGIVDSGIFADVAQMVIVAGGPGIRRLIRQIR